MTPDLAEPLQSVIQNYAVGILTIIASFVSLVAGAFFWFVKRILKNQDKVSDGALASYRDLNNAVTHIREEFDKHINRFSEYVVKSEQANSKLINRYHELDKELSLVIKDAHNASQTVQEVKGAVDALRRTVNENSKELTTTAVKVDKLFQVVESDPRATDAMIAIGRMKKKQSGGR